MRYGVHTIKVSHDIDIEPIQKIPEAIKLFTSQSLNVHQITYNLQCAGYGAELVWIKNAKCYGVIANVSGKERWLAYVDNQSDIRKWVIKEYKDARIDY